MVKLHCFCDIQLQTKSTVKCDLETWVMGHSKAMTLSDRLYVTSY